MVAMVSRWKCSAAILPTREWKPHSNGQKNFSKIGKASFLYYGNCLFMNESDDDN